MSEYSKIIGHENIISQLISAVSMSKINHAYIFNGPDGSGKNMLAKAFAQALLCEKQGPEGCGEVGLMDKHIGLAVKKRVKFQVVVAKDTVHVLSAAAADEQYAQLRGFVHDLLDDLRALPYQKFIGIGFLLIGVLIGHHCVDGEAVMLAADAEGLVGLAQIL